jgi:NAD+ synthase
MRLPTDCRAIIAGFIQHRVADAGASGVVLGLSGGIDSATALAIAVEALGAEAVHGLLLPHGETVSTEMAAAHAGALAVETREVDIAPLASAFGDTADFFKSREQQGNLRARLRMALLYGAAADRGALVLGTSNKSELLTGYYTKWGDGGADLLPLGDLYKSQIQLLATALGVPAAICERTPTAELWEGQTDEQELGLPYAQLDPLLAALERQDSPAKTATQGLSEGEMARAAALVQRSIHKRIFPPVCKLGRRTVGIDWRETTGVRR